ncbi:hypothetical protein Tco_1372537 [Tanacetum coccineum]
MNGIECWSEKTPNYLLSAELLKERELEEIKAGGFGKGELQGPYVEEVDPMPHNDEYKHGGNKGIIRSNVNVETNDEPREGSKVSEAVDISANEYDSLAYARLCDNDEFGIA